ncbi:zinc-binding dehydrogenase [Desertimonas flava]|uniref:zinc-binding dehydrogenase n=1 Tax=Desertimonas flava TaxID=2064846 RepID=UPI000E348EF1|nr:zinc-binding dehydrogenase [Desertimonas flava]
MRAAIWTGEALEVHGDVDVRPPGDGEVLVEIAAAGLCHSDLNPMTGSYPQPVPAVLGHEAVGRVVDGAAHLVGRRVVLTPIVACGSCPRCRGGSPTTCTTPPPPRPPVFSRSGSTVHQFVNLGAFTERTVVLASQVVAVPDDLPDAEAALLGCAVVTGVGAVERAGVVAGETVLVTGAGGIGLNAVQGARLAGARRVIVADRNPAKEAIARRLGATDFIVVGEAGLPAALADADVDPVDAAIECTGNVGVLEASIGALGRGGRVVIVGLPGAGEAMTVPVRSLFHDKAILGSRMGSVDPHTAIPRLAAQAVAGDLQLAPLVSRVVPLEAIAGLVDDLEHGRLDRGLLHL